MTREVDELVTNPHHCSIKLLTPDLHVDAAAHAISINAANSPAAHMLAGGDAEALIRPAHLALLTAKYWGAAGVRLRVGFMDSPTKALRDKILSHMNSWGNYSNVEFVYSDTDPQVRISRTPGGGHWSYLGTDVDKVPKGEATMNLDGFTINTEDSEFFRVVRHETGHTLGFPHEHTRSDIVSRIDPAKAMAFYGAPPNSWTPAQVQSQVLTPLDNSALIATEQADPKSIMTYWLPSSIMTDGIAVPGGSDLDALDKKFAASVYPPKTSQPQTAPMSNKNAAPEYSQDQNDGDLDSVLRSGAKQMLADAVRKEVACHSSMPALQYGTGSGWSAPSFTSDVAPAPSGSEAEILHKASAQLTHYVSATHRARNANILGADFQMVAAAAAPADTPTPSALSAMLNSVVKAPGTTSIATVPKSPNTDQVSMLGSIQTLDSYISLLTAFSLYNEHPEPYDITVPAQATAFTRATAKWRNFVITGGVVKAMAGYLPVGNIVTQSYSKSVTSADLHLEFLGELFKDFSFPAAAMTQLDGILTKVFAKLGNLNFSFEKATDTMDHFLSYYYFTTVAGTGEGTPIPAMFVPRIRTFYLHIDQSTWKATVGKSSVNHFNFNMNYFDMATTMNPNLVANDMSVINETIQTLSGKTAEEVQSLMNMQAIQAEPQKA